MLLISCGGGGGDGSKPIFSLWHHTVTDSPLDLRDGGFDQPMTIAFYYPDGAQCNCNFTVIGDNASGTYVVNNCYYDYGSGSGDPGCNARNETGTYNITNNQLTACGGGSCDTFY